MAKPIKDLKDLRASGVSAAIDIQDLKDLKRTRDVFSVARTMARETLSDARVACEGPRPTVNGNDFLFLTVGRGPVPRHAAIAGACPPRYGKNGTSS